MIANLSLQGELVAIPVMVWIIHKHKLIFLSGGLVALDAIVTLFLTHSMGICLCSV